MATWTVPATVTRIVDGDTLVARADLGWRISLETYVRLSGVDAPERGTDAGTAATSYLGGLLPAGTRVTLVSHRLLGVSDNYGRILASVMLPDGRDVSALLLETGHAQVYR